MKKQNLILIYFGLIALFFQSCGPNAEQIAKQKAQDSIKLITEKEQKGEIIWQNDANGYFVDMRDSKKYKVVKIGNQTWMAENLAFKANSGCFAYNSNDANVANYGYLYNWETAKTVCPSGWHLPSDAEWSSLTDFLGGQVVAGEKMKATSGWDEKGYGSNSSGFSGLPGGTYVNLIGNFTSIGRYGNWWSSTEAPYNQAWNYLMDYNSGNATRCAMGDKMDYLSVRCIKDL